MTNPTTSNSSTTSVAFLGLGVMGYPMAANLVQAGHHVTVYNRSTKKSEAWVNEFGGSSAPTPAEAAAGADIVLSCVGDDTSLRQVTVGEHGAFATMNAGTVYVDHSTTSAALARELHATAEEMGVSFLDAPISGGEAGAQNGTLAIMVGGDTEAFTAAEPTFNAYASIVRLVGGPGAGQTTKMINQICIAGLIQALAEGMHFAQASGVNIEAVLEVITGGAASSWQMNNRAETMLAGKYDHGFAVDLMRKDLGIVLTEANNLGVSLPVTALVDQFYTDIQAAGDGRLDTSSLLKRLQ